MNGDEKAVSLDPLQVLLEWCNSCSCAIAAQHLGSLTLLTQQRGRLEWPACAWHAQQKSSRMRQPSVAGTLANLLFCRACSHRCRRTG